ncbi:MAG: protein-L-isoaspartate(D-aspartate) O-methyltransferase [Rhodospirillaceae bacterium]|nr:protein-L-isoaspartate(D-aspartate) O-methyltransferase [Rhodospirillaceae bacterium]
MPKLPDAERSWVAERQRLTDEIAGDALATSGMTGRRSFAPAIMGAVNRVPRQEFVPAEHRGRAYENVPLPIGHGQTISQPYIVALMTDLAAPTKGDTVLEIGTGCGYQTAVLAELAGTVCSIEIVPELQIAAAERLARLGYRNVALATGDGHRGWPEKAPFDAIVVTAAADAIPPALIDQLKPGGRLVLPVRSGPGRQHLILGEKGADGELRTRPILPVAFVPFRGPLEPS